MQRPDPRLSVNVAVTISRNRVLTIRWHQFQWGGRVGSNVSRPRLMLVVLMALVMAAMPVAAAAFGRVLSDVSFKLPAQGETSADATNQATAMDMADCDHAMQGTSNFDCPCCDVESACPPDFCPLTHHKVFGVEHFPDQRPMSARSHLRPTLSATPSSWHISPPAPPPRT